MITRKHWDRYIRDLYNAMDNDARVQIGGERVLKVCLDTGRAWTTHNGGTRSKKVFSFENSVHSGTRLDQIYIAVTVTHTLSDLRRNVIEQWMAEQALETERTE